MKIKISEVDLGNSKRQKTSHSQKTEIKTDPSVRIPEPHQAKIDNDNLQKYINSFSASKYKRTAKWMTDNYEYISFDM